MRKMHFYLFNIGDYQTHTNHLSEMEDLAYRRLLDWYYLHEKPLPLDVDDIAKRIRMRSHTDCIAFVLQEFFERTAEGFVNHRADQVIAVARQKSAKASESANARWGKKPIKNNTIKKDANALPTQSEGNAIQESIINNKKPSKDKTAFAVICPEGVDQQVWNDWIAIRKAKRLPLTPTAWSQLEAEAQKAGLSMDTVIKECCLRGWGAFKASWWEREVAGGTVKKSQSERNEEIFNALTGNVFVGGSDVKLLGN